MLVDSLRHPEERARRRCPPEPFRGRSLAHPSAKTIAAFIRRDGEAARARDVSSIGPGGSHNGVLWKWVPPGGRLQPALKKVVRSLAPNSLDLNCASPNLPAKYGAVRALALRTILRNASPSWSGPRFDKRREVRSRSQPIFLKVWLRISEAIPGTELHAQPRLPPETTPGNCTGTGGRRDAARGRTRLVPAHALRCGSRAFLSGGPRSGPVSPLDAVSAGD